MLSHNSDAFGMADSTSSIATLRAFRAGNNAMSDTNVTIEPMSPNGDGRTTVTSMGSLAAIVHDLQCDLKDLRVRVEQMNQHQLEVLDTLQQERQRRQILEKATLERHESTKIAVRNLTHTCNSSMDSMRNDVESLCQRLGEQSVAIEDAIEDSKTDCKEVADRTQQLTVDLHTRINDICERQRQPLPLQPACRDTSAEPPRPSLSSLRSRQIATFEEPRPTARSYGGHMPFEVVRTTGHMPNGASATSLAKDLRSALMSRVPATSPAMCTRAASPPAEYRARVLASEFDKTTSPQSKFSMLQRSSSAGVLLKQPPSRIAAPMAMSVSPPLISELAPQQPQTARPHLAGWGSAPAPPPHSVAQALPPGMMQMQPGSMAWASVGCQLPRGPLF